MGSSVQVMLWTPTFVCVTPRSECLRLFFWKIGSAVPPCPRRKERVCGAKESMMLFGTRCPRGPGERKDSGKNRFFAECPIDGGFRYH
ncbi:uncharacterized protein LY79DRAFT_551433 [Colletotrichum navitas]|uniref:Uncharacterized protein n=1 Tax=Colletotrichum navitas TaxID=681940 RepID=A0AAD8Q0M9_9PEZI|nr:uncharacterized protein LY79DRAFT_551433 [Colletotrichum navitas]KAK1593625.1 hypothetical protein LY79DRAFT_551433 [Colletotrichum navitas]